MIKQLYLSDPSQSLDRIDPVDTADATTVTTGNFSAGGTITTLYNESPLCADLTIKAGVISVKTYVTISSGTMPADAELLQHYYSMALPILLPLQIHLYSGILTWTATLLPMLLVPAGLTISLEHQFAQAGVTFKIDYDSQTKPQN